MNRTRFAFDRKNFMLIAAGMVIIIIGFALMLGSSSNETTFAADVFSVRRIRVAPVVSLIGFVLIIYGVLRKPRF